MSQDEQKNIGMRIAQLRREHGLTQVQFAEIIGVSRDTLSKIEKGLKSPGDLIPIICRKETYHQTLFTSEELTLGTKSRKLVISAKSRFKYSLNV